MADYANETKHVAPGWNSFRFDTLVARHLKPSRATAEPPRIARQCLSSQVPLSNRIQKWFQTSRSCLVELIKIKFDTAGARRLQRPLVFSCTILFNSNRT